MKKVFLLAIIVLFLLFVAVSCASKVEYVYVPIEYDYVTLFQPLLATRPNPPILIEDVQSIQDVMANSVAFQTAYYNFADYSTALERAILNLPSFSDVPI